MLESASNIKQMYSPISSWLALLKVRIIVSVPTSNLLSRFSSILQLPKREAKFCYISCWCVAVVVAAMLLLLLLLLCCCCCCCYVVVVVVAAMLI